MIKININNEIDIYRTTLDFNSNFDKKIFIDKLKIVDTLVEASRPAKKTPGRQSALSEMYMPELNFIKVLLQKIAKYPQVSRIIFETLLNGIPSKKIIEFLVCNLHKTECRKKVC